MPDTASVPRPGFAAFCQRHYRVLAAAVLALAAFNLLYRLGSEVVIEWDESLYAISATEIVSSGHWIGVTFLGHLDYYNAKPPLNVWLIALSFKAFGASLLSLRLASVASAWLTVAVLMWWTRRAVTEAASLAAGLVLSTSFGFLYVHAARNANTDAMFALLILLAVVVLWAAHDRPWLRMFLGPILAATFLLRGMGVLMPLAIVGVAEVTRRRAPRERWRPLAAAAALFVVPAGAWAIARWSLDQWQFFEPLFSYDFVARTFGSIEGHQGGPLYYLNVLQKDAYEWLFAGALAWILFPLPWARVRAGVRSWFRPGGPTEVSAWAGATLLIPTLMRTKVAWYLNPFFPVFAAGVGWLVANGLSQPEIGGRARRNRAILAVAVVAAFAVAEGKLVWYSFHYRDLGHTVQGLLLGERDRLAGHGVYRVHWDNADFFVTRLVGADGRVAPDVDAFLRTSRPGDFYLSSQDETCPNLALVRSDGDLRIYQRQN